MIEPPSDPAGQLVLRFLMGRGTGTWAAPFEAQDYRSEFADPR